VNGAELRFLLQAYKFLWAFQKVSASKISLSKGNTLNKKHGQRFVVDRA
jgi:hypothetical protein